MPRQTTRKIKSSQVGKTPKRTPVTTEVVSYPISTYVGSPVRIGPIGKSNLQQLAESLSQVRPGLDQYLLSEEARRAAAGKAEGEKERLKLTDLSRKEIDQLVKKGEISRFEDPYFQAGFMRMHGRLEAERFIREVSQTYETDFDQDTGDIDAFMAEHVTSTLAGADDQDFLRGFIPRVEEFHGKLKVAHLEDRVEAVQSEMNNKVYQQFYYALTGDEPVTMEKWQEIYDIGKELKMEYRDLDALAFQAAEAASREGDYHTFDILYQKKPDGTPGMAKNPKWADKIAQARYTAEQRWLSAYDRNERWEEKARRDRQEKVAGALWRVVLDGKSPMKELNQALNKDLIDYREYVTMRRFMLTVDDADKDDENLIALTALEEGLIRGVYNRDDILEAVADGTILTKSTMQSFMNLWLRLNDSGGVFQSKDYKAGFDYIKGYMTPGSILRFDKSLEQLRSRALLDYFERVGELKEITPSAIREIRDDIIKRYGPPPSESNLPKPLYPNLEQLAAAYEKGEVDGRTFLREEKLLKALGEENPQYLYVEPTIPTAIGDLELQSSH